MLFAPTLLLLPTAPAQACTAMDTALPPSLAAWTTQGNGSPRDFTKPVVIGGVTPEDQARLDAMPHDRPATEAELAALRRVPMVPPDTGGMARILFRIDKPGRYGIALDQAGWIDVAPIDGKPLTSVQHGHGPDCSTIRKIVRFELQPGLYQLSLTKLTKPKAKAMLVTGD